MKEVSFFFFCSFDNNLHFHRAFLEGMAHPEEAQEKAMIYDFIEKHVGPHNSSASTASLSILHLILYVQHDGLNSHILALNGTPSRIDVMK